MKKIVTISREFASGGDELAAALARRLEYRLLDREIITRAAEKSGIHEENFEAVDQKPTNSLLYSVVMGMYSAQGAFVKYDDILTDDRIFKIQSEIIREMTADGGCIIIGRCADYILRDNPDCINLFIHADIDTRIQKLRAHQKELSESEARKMLSKSDKKRRSYYNYYTNKEWGKVTNYDICLDLTKINEEKAAEVVAKYVELESEN